MLVCCQMTNFSDWLTNEIRQRGMSPASLARLMKKDSGVVSRMLSGMRNPSNETLEAVAKALDLPARIVFQAAGVHLEDEDISPRGREADHLLRQLPDYEQDGIIETIRLRLKLFNQSGKNETKRVPKNIR